MLQESDRLATHQGDAAVDAVTDFVGRVLAATRSSTAANLASTDLTFSQVRILFVLLQSDEGLPTHEVADHLGLSLAATGRAADRLVTLGFVDRREDPRDRRVKRLSLTAAGDELLTEHFRLREDDVRNLLTPLPDDVRDRLRQALTEAAGYLPEHGICRPRTAPVT
ncbi:MarR family winged helix-turn-helix transcriptional regulator [Gordonia iterans]